MKKFNFNPLFSILFFGFIVSCSTIDKKQPATQLDDGKKELSYRLPESWNARGRIAVIHPDENWHAHFAWQQKKGNYQLRFSGPLGQTQLFVEHKQNKQTGEQSNILIMGDEKYHNNQSMDLLLEQFSPVKVPLTSLKYWLYGQHNPLATHQLSKDTSGRTEQLQQSGWKISFKKYQQSHLWTYPNKITAQKDGHKIKVFISSREIQE